jgi:hypothetical protein
MTKITITEALAEIKTLGKRITKKREFIKPLLFRQEQLKDPLEKEGGSRKAVTEATQSIRDMAQRIVDIRLAIQKANLENSITLENESKTIAEWIVWKREIAPVLVAAQTDQINTIQSCRKQATEKGLKFVGEGDLNAFDIHININELELAESIDKMERLIGTLDGQLSLQNALITIEI